MTTASDQRLLNRIIFALSMLGILVVVHLGIQQSRGFDQGCVGFLGGAESSAGCVAALQSGASTFLGVSNTIWGFLFYVGVAVLSAAVLLARPSTQARAAKLRALLIGFGLIYSAYLVYYQYANLEQYCILCLMSAGIVLLLAVVQGIALAGGGGATPTTRRTAADSSMKELKYIGALVVAVVVLMGADLIYFNQIERQEPAVASTDRSGGSSAARSTDFQPPAQCGYDDAMPTVEQYMDLIGVQDPMVGNPDAEVTVVEFFDPNCPHCKTMHGIMADVISEHGDEARFFYKPVALWPYSVNQIQALYAAAQENKFPEMLEKQFERQQQGGLSMNQLRSIAEEIGMNADQLQQRLERNIFRPQVDQQRQIAQSVGLRGVPAVMINGRFVGPTSRSVGCIGDLIESAAN